MTHSAPAMARSNNTTLIATQGPNHTLEFWWNSDGDPNWHWSGIAGPGTAYSAPAICRGFGDILVGGTIVAVRGPKNELFVFWNLDGDPTWYPFSQVSVAPVHSAPSKAVRSSVRLITRERNLVGHHLVMGSEPKTFAHRYTEAGEVESVCMLCFLTLAPSCSEQEMQANEGQHVCRPDLPPFAFFCGEA